MKKKSDVTATQTITAKQVIEQLRELGNPDVKVGMARFAIKSDKAIGVKLPELRAYAKMLKRNHALALDLWKTEIHEARLLATMIADPALVDDSLMERWVKDFDSWDICDQCCGNLFDKTPIASTKALVWSKRKNEFEKRAGFAMMATLAVHDKKAPDSAFTQFFEPIEREASDERNFVKKAVNWALRQIGKRNSSLNIIAVTVARQIAKQDSKSARWIAADALRELTSDAVLQKFSNKK